MKSWNVEKVRENSTLMNNLSLSDILQGKLFKNNNQIKSDSNSRIDHGQFDVPEYEHDSETEIPDRSKLSNI